MPRLTESVAHADDARRQRERQEAEFHAEWLAANPDLADECSAPAPEPPPVWTIRAKDTDDTPAERQGSLRTAPKADYRPRSGTIAWFVLEAAKTLPTPFSFSSLAVDCYENHRGMFGLEDHAGHYPDTRKVWNCLYGVRGLVTRGLLRKVGDKFEAVT